MSTFQLRVDADAKEKASRETSLQLYPAGDTARRLSGGLGGVAGRTH